MGYETVAVYSDADKEALHVKMAGESVCIGPAEASMSYMNIERIIQASIETGADAIHPGYGFLSENPAFAEACIENGITFIGPDPHAIRVMGNKAAAKRRMAKAGVPCVPGYEGEDQSDSQFIEAALEIGFPVMVKRHKAEAGEECALSKNLKNWRKP